MVRYWVVRMMMKSSESTLLDCEIGRDNNFVGIGASNRGDLTNCTKEELRDKLKAHNPEPLGTLNNRVSHYNSFINKMETNDIVVLPIYPEHDPENYFKKYLVGRVKSRPYYERNPQDNAMAKIRRNVKWLIEILKGTLSARLNKSLESPHTVYNIDKHEREIQSLLKGKS